MFNLPEPHYHVVLLSEKLKILNSFPESYLGHVINNSTHVTVYMQKQQHHLESNQVKTFGQYCLLACSKLTCDQAYK